jgi:hypothetical protein
MVLLPATVDGLNGQMVDSEKQKAAPAAPPLFLHIPLDQSTISPLDQIKSRIDFI